MKQDNTVHSERKFSSLDDIRAYKEELLEQIRQDSDVISTKWNNPTEQGPEDNENAQHGHGRARRSYARMETLPQISRRRFPIRKT